MKYCLVNGIQQNHIDIESRGFAYGDGLFTTAKILNGEVQYLKQHIERLVIGCNKLGINAPESSALTLQLKAVAKNYSLAVLKVVISASSGGRGYARSLNNSHDEIIMVYDYPAHYDNQACAGISLGVSDQRIGVNPMLSGLKHLNRLEQVLLRQELSASNVDDLLVMNINNEVIEATSANLFYFMNDQLYTPDVKYSGVNGIMRQTLLKHYPETIVKTTSLNEISKAQAMFICNCVMGIMPIANFNGCDLPIMQPVAIHNSINNDVN